MKYCSVFKLVLAFCFFFIVVISSNASTLIVASSLTYSGDTIFCGGELNENPCSGQVDLLPFIDDSCTNTLLTWQLDLEADGIYDSTGTKGFSGRLPLGEHAILFELLDDCPDKKLLQINFEVIDCEPPHPICKNGYFIDISQLVGLPEIKAEDINIASFDNCHQIELRLNRIKDFNGDFKIDTLDYLTAPPPLPNDPIYFDCLDFICGERTFPVQLWAGEISNDTVNNWSSCLTFIDFGLEPDMCTTDLSIDGDIVNINGIPLENVPVFWHTDSTLIKEEKTNSNGEFHFCNSTSPKNLTLNPFYDKEAWEGIHGIDLVKVAKHILNIELLDSPYKMIAADVNNSGAITTIDLIMMRKVLLRVKDSFPQNTSWRFVDAGYEFPDLKNPWKEPFPEIISADHYGILVPEKSKFIGIKIGDVIGHAIIK